jgi:hypothetical protein
MMTRRDRQVFVTVLVVLMILGAAVGSIGNLAAAVSR